MRRGVNADLCTAVKDLCVQVGTIVPYSPLTETAFCPSACVEQRLKSGSIALCATDDIRAAQFFWTLDVGRSESSLMEVMELSDNSRAFTSALALCRSTSSSLHLCLSSSCSGDRS